MPLTEDEWENEEHRKNKKAEEPNPVDEETLTRQLVITFLAENGDYAYTKREILKGVNFGKKVSKQEGLTERVKNLPDQFIDISGSIIATGIAIRDIENALQSLEDDGFVESRVVEKGEEEKVYYRISEGSSHTFLEKRTGTKVDSTEK